MVVLWRESLFKRWDGECSGTSVVAEQRVSGYTTRQGDTGHRMATE